MGINLGDIVVEGEDISGDDVWRRRLLWPRFLRRCDGEQAALDH
jgi:hypothetical protein